MSSPNNSSDAKPDESFNSFENITQIDFDKELRKYHISDEENEIEEKVQLNPFPVEIFPDAIQEIILATKENLNFPIDFIGTAILSATSIAIGNTHKAELKKGFQESPVLYVALVSPPGTNKSHPLHFAMQPIMEKDNASYRKYENDRIEFEKYLATSKNDKEKHPNDVTKPFWRKHIISDFTPEALAQVHKNNKRGIGVYVDELAGWFKNFNRYNKGSEMEFWLSTFNSKPINIDRKSGEPVFIPVPFISVIGTIQNGLLYELAKDGRMLNGFIDRILFAMPDNIQKPYWTENELDIKVVEGWKRIILNILNIPIEVDESFNLKPQILKFNTDAKRILFKWQHYNTDQCNRERNEVLKGIYSKHEMYVIRLALILELLRWSCNESGKLEISVESVKGAIRLIQYYKHTALKVYSIMSKSNPLKDIPEERLNLYKSLPPFFTTEIGLKMALSVGVSERTFKRFLNEKELFVRIRQGEYGKLH